MQSVFFDLDGTLTDPKPGITRCIQHALSALDSPFPSEDELTGCIGPPLLENSGYGDSEELRAAGADELAADPGSRQALLVMEG